MPLRSQPQLWPSMQADLDFWLTMRASRRCNVTVRRDARMVNQKSKSACIEGQSWGWDRSGIWVTRGCRADFQVY